MANVVEIVLNGKDLTGPAFKTATGNLAALSTNAKVAGGAFRALSTAAQQLGSGPLGSMIGAVSHGVIGLREMSMELGKSKLAWAALGVAAVGVGFSIGTAIDNSFFSGKEVRNLEQAAKFGEEWSNVLRKISAVSGGAHAQQQQVLQSIEATIARIQGMQEIPGVGGIKMLGGQEGLSASEVDAIIDKYRQLKDAVADAQKTANTEAMDKLWANLRASQGKVERPGPESFGITSTITQSFDTPQQAQEVLLFNANLDAMRASFEKFTTDKDERSAFYAQVEAQRAEGLTKLITGYEQQSANQRRAIQASFATSYGSILGSMANAAALFGAKGFRVWQAFKIAEAIVTTYAAALNAYNSQVGIPVVGPALAKVAAVAAVTFGLVQIATIASTKPPSGQAHGGLDYVPTTGTYVLQQGEAVVRSNENARLSRFLDQMEGRGDRGGTTHVHKTIIDGRELGELIYQLSRDGRLSIDGRSVQG